MVHTLPTDREQTHQQRDKQDEDDRVQNQAAQLGRALWGGDPAAGDRTHKLVRLGAGDDHVSDGWEQGELELGHLYYITRKYLFKIMPTPEWTKMIGTSLLASLQELTGAPREEKRIFEDAIRAIIEDVCE